MNKLKIGTRLSIAFSILFIIIITISYSGLNGLNKSFAVIEDMHSGNVIPMQQIGTIQYLAIRNRVIIMDTLINNDPVNIQKRIYGY